MGRRIWLLIPAACALAGVLDALQTFVSARLDGNALEWGELVFRGCEWLFLGALTPLTYFLGRRYPLVAGRWRRVVAAHLVGALGLCVGWALLGLLLGLALQRFPAQGELGTAYTRWLLISLPWSVFLYLTMLGCVYAIAYFREARDREAQAARLAAQLAEARLDALRMELNPHFLFNSLNALSVLVRDRDVTAASRVIELLSGLLRDVLDDRPHEIPLADELRFIAQYLEIEQVRFSDRLTVDLAIEDAARRALVPAFVLQPLVENAIKHGIARRAGAGRIAVTARITGDRLALVVSDDGPGPRSDAGEGVGLSNTRSRLAAIYGDGARVELRVGDAGTEVELDLPHREEPA